MSLHRRQTRCCTLATRPCDISNTFNQSFTPRGGNFEGIRRVYPMKAIDLGFVSTTQRLQIEKR